MNRRTLLALTVVGAAPLPVTAQALQPLPPVTSPDHPDAALFAACARSVAVWDEVEALHAPADEAVLDALVDRWADTIAEVSHLRARTKAGCKAKARVLILYMEGNEPRKGGDGERLLAWRLAHDVLLGAMA